MAGQRARPSEAWILDDGIIMGGGQRFALRLAGVMRDEGLPVGFVTPAGCRLSAEARSAGFPIRDVRYPRLVPPAFWAMPRTVAQLRRALAGLPPDALVIGNTARCQGYAAAAMVTLRRRPLLVHLMQEQDSAHRRTARAVYRRIGALVAVGENAAQTYRRHLPEVAVTRINNFVAGADMARMVGERTPPPGGARPVLGVLARMIPEKGLLELVDELAAIPGVWERLLVGAAPQDRRYTQAVRDRIAHHGLGDRIELLGEIHALPRLFDAIDALVVPSIGNEGQPTVIIEGLLHGRPVIVREPLWSDAFSGLPVRRYRTAADLAAALTQPPGEPVDLPTLTARFGGEELVSRLTVAARAAASEERPGELARPIGGRRPGGYEWTRHLMRHRTVTRRGSPVPTLSSYPVFVAGLPRTVTGRGPGFQFAGTTYRYLYHRYNNTWMNERAVEVPIAGEAIAARPAARVLEIGNVLSHYLPARHEIVDKYEHGSGVRNIDVLDLEPGRRWDMIVSISTLEHVGVDDAPHDPARGAAAAAMLASRLAPGGELLLTVPVGYNPELDRALTAGTLPGMELRALRRTAPGPSWQEAEPRAVLGLGYDWRNSSARAVLVGRLRRSPEPA